MASVTLNGWWDILGGDFCEKHENDFSEYAGFVGFYLTSPMLHKLLFNIFLKVVNFRTVFSPLGISFVYDSCS